MNNVFWVAIIVVLFAIVIFHTSCSESATPLPRFHYDLRAMSNHLMKTKRRYIHQSDFRHGTLRITKPGYYQLTEDIVFDPVVSKDTISDEFKKPEFHLGFFCAICIECKDVVLDLNSFTICQSKRFYLLQRFFSIVELSNTMFPTNKGPGFFGVHRRSCYNIVIRNGNLGLSSHYGIHGNEVVNLLVEDVRIFDFEVAGVHINGANCLSFHRVGVGPSACSLPVNDRLSHMKNEIKTFQIANETKFYGKLGELELSVGGETYTGADLLGALQKKYNHCLQSGIEAYGDPEEVEKIPEEVRNSLSGFSPVNVYGIVLKGSGLLVDDFPSDEGTFNNRGYNIHLRHVSVKGIVSHPTDVRGMLCNGCNVNYGINVVKGSSGAVFNVDRFFQKKGYVPNELQNMQLFLSEHVHKHKIAQSIVEWSRHTGEEPFPFPEDVEYITGIDSMAHTMKGNHGILFSQTENITMVDVCVDGVTNLSDTSFQGHEEFSTMGGSSNGVTFSHCDMESVVAKKVVVDNIMSRRGKVYFLGSRSGKGVASQVASIE